MELRQVSITKSPQSAGCVRLTGDVYYDDRKIEPEIYWFEVDDIYEPYLSDSGNTWLVCLLPLAVSLGESLRISRPVDPVLYENAQELMEIWKCWYPHLKIVPIEAELAKITDNKNQSRTASFFSGGVDAFFTALHYKSQSENIPVKVIDDLIYVWGFDIPLTNIEGYLRMIEILQCAADKLNKKLVRVKTNLRRTRLEKTNWGEFSGWGSLYHGAALSSVALALEKRYSSIMISSTYKYNQLYPWGSHPLTDPLFSTSKTKIIHYGAIFDRVGKLSFLDKFEIVQRSLHVCFMEGTDENCCNCIKCYRNMAILETLGVLKKFITFNKKPFSLKTLSMLYIPEQGDIESFKGIRNLALQKGRRDIASAINRSIRHTKRIVLYMRFLGWIRKQKNRRFIQWLRRHISGAWVSSLERFFLKGLVLE